MDDLRGRFSVRRNDYALPPKPLKPVYMQGPVAPKPSPVATPKPVEQLRPVYMQAQAPSRPAQPPQSAQPAPPEIQNDPFASELIDNDDYVFEPATETTTNEFIPLLPEEDDGGATPPIQSPVQLYQPQQAATNKSHKLVLLGGTATVVVAGIIIAGSWLYFFKGAAGQSGLPGAVTSALNFQAFFPRQLPAGYVYQIGSASGSTAGLQYKLANGGEVITVTEQPLNGAVYHLGQLPNSSLLNLPQGQARVSVGSDNLPEGILVTKKLDIDVRGNIDVAMPDLTAVVESLVPSAGTQ